MAPRRRAALPLILGLWALVARAGGASWTATTALPDAYNGHTMVYSSGRLYLAGGISFNGGIVDAVRVYSAPVSPAGTIGAWTAGTSLPEAVFYHASAAANGFVYVLGGYHYSDADGITVSNAVSYAKINADGSLGAWQTGTHLPQPVFFVSATVWNGRIYVTGGWNGVALTNAVYSAAVNQDGSLGPWTAEKPLPEAVYTHAEVSNGTLYVLGGTVHGGADIQNVVYFAKINADGTLADWAMASPLPQPVANHGAVLANGRVIVMGGWTGSSPTSEVNSAAVGADGNLGGWSPEAPLPRSLYMHAAAVDATHVFVSGGNDPVSMRADVYSMPLPPPPPPSDSLPPRTDLAFTGPLFGATPFISPATLARLTAIDDSRAVGDGAGVGVAGTQWAVDDGVFAAYTAPFSVHNDGGHWIRYMSVDALGHAEAVRATSAAVDGTAPVSSLSVGAPQAVLSSGEIIVGPATPLAVSAADPVVNGAASGVAQVFAGIDGGALSASDTSFVLPAVDGAHRVSMRADDNVGNAETAHEATVYRDATPPQTSLALAAFSPADGGAPIASASALLSFSALDPADAGGVAAGVHHTEFALDGGTASTYTGAFGLIEGSHSLSYRSVDNVGNAEAWRTAAYRSDATLPQSSLSWEGAPVSPTPASAFTLSAQDPASNGVASGVRRILYSVDGGPDQPYSLPFLLSLGRHTIAFAAADNAGNVEDRNSVTVAVGAADSLPPRTTLAFGSPLFGSVPFITPATPAALSATDDARVVGDGAGAGIAATQWALDDGAFSDYSAPIKIAADGVHWIRFMSVDAAGHAEAVRASSAAVDGTAPVSELTIGAPQALLASGEVIVGPATALAVSAADPLVGGVASGVAWTRAGVDGAAPAELSGSFLLPASDGAHTVALQAADNLGNTEAAHAVTVYRDAAAPATTLAFSAAPYAGASGSIYGASTLMSFTATDPASGGAAAGVHHTEYSFDGGAATAYTGAFGAAEGPHTLSFHSVDNVGNAEAARSVTFLIDATPPQTTLAVSGGGGATLFGEDILTSDAALTLTAQDPASAGAASGVKRIVYSVDGGPDQVYAAGFHLGAGRHTLSYGAEDNAGNVETRSVAAVSVGEFLSAALAATGNIELSDKAGVVGVVRTNAAFTADDRSFVDGDVAGMTVTLGNHASVSGAVTRGQATVVSPAYDMNAARAWAKANNNNAALPARLLHDGALVLESRENVTLPAGDYYLTGLRLRGKSSVSVSGRVNIFLDGPLTMRGGSALNGSGDAGALWIVSAAQANGAYERSGDDDERGEEDDSEDGRNQDYGVFLNGKSRAAFNLYAPLAAIRAMGKGEFAGRVLAKTASLSGKALQPSLSALPPAQHKPGLAEHRLPPERREGAGTAAAGHAQGRDSAVALSRLDSAAPRVAARGSSAEAAKAPAGPAPTVASAARQGEPREPKHLAPARAPETGTGTAGPGHSRGTESAAAVSELAHREPSREKGRAVMPSLPGLSGGSTGAFSRASRVAAAHMPAFKLSGRAAFSAVGSNGNAVRAGDRSAVVIPEGAATANLGVTVSPPKTNDVIENKRQAEVQSRKGIVAASAGVQYGPEGTHFAKPVTLELPYDRAHLPAGVAENELRVHYWNPVNSDWEQLESSVDTQNQVVRAQTMHFSLYQIFGGGSGSASAPASVNDPSFSVHAAYAFPNPARGTVPVTFRVLPGLADSVSVRVYDLSGRLVHESSGFQNLGSIPDVNGSGPQYTFEHLWDVSGVASGVYTFIVTGHKAGERDINASGKIGVVK